MATFDELITFGQGADYTGLRNKVRVAVAIKAAEIVNDVAATAEQKAWAKEALASPGATAETITNYVLAANASATIAQITAATDATIQGNVDDAVDKLFGAA